MPNIFRRKKKKVVEKKYVIKADNGNYLGYLSFRKNRQGELVKDTLWFVDIQNALPIDSLKLASTIMSYLGGCHLEEIV